MSGKRGKTWKNDLKEVEKIVMDTAKYGCNTRLLGSQRHLGGRAKITQCIEIDG